MQSDAEMAYVQATLKGCATWVRLPKDRWPCHKAFTPHRSRAQPPLLAGFVAHVAFDASAVKGQKTAFKLQWYVARACAPFTVVRSIPQGSTSD
eukprot:1747656-Amphidinium_carterae.2